MVVDVHGFLPSFLVMFGVVCRVTRPADKKSPAFPPGFFVSAGRNVAGFTTVELIVVIIVAGILAAVALPRWAGDTGFEERALHDETVSALRYAQKTAIAARRTVCATFTATELSFRMATAAGATDCSAGGVLVGPQGDPLQVSAKSGGFGSFPPAGVIFDAAGRTTAVASIEISGLPELPITVEVETGYVH